MAAKVGPPSSRNCTMRSDEVKGETVADGVRCGRPPPGSHARRVQCTNRKQTKTNPKMVRGARSVRVKSTSNFTTSTNNAAAVARQTNRLLIGTCRAQVGLPRPSWQASSGKAAASSSNKRRQGQAGCSSGRSAHKQLPFQGCKLLSFSTTRAPTPSTGVEQTAGWSKMLFVLPAFMLLALS